MGPPRRRRRHRRPQLTRLGDNANAPNAIPTGAPFVAAQWTFDAYGQVLSADHLAPHPFMHAGHKGLFFDRLDVGVADPAVPGAAIGASVGTTESPRLVPFAHSIYHNRNRAYNPQFGRFMQADPNALGMILVDDMWQFHGEPTWQIPMRLNLRAHFQDGANMYAYLGGNPWMRADPLGLWVIGPNDTTYDPTTGEFEPSPWSPNHPMNKRPQAPDASGNRTGKSWHPNPAEFVGMAGNAGRIVGAYAAAAMFGDNLNRSSNSNLNQIYRDAGINLRFDGLHFGFGLLGLKGVPPRTILYGVGWGLKEAESGWLAASVELGIGLGGDLAASRVSNTVGMYLAPFAFAAGVYGGIIEYAADGINDW